MDIGVAKRRYTVEPVQDPVPRSEPAPPARSAERPAPAPPVSSTPRR